MKIMTILVISLFLLVQTAFTGTLRDFEKDATKTDGSSTLDRNIYKNDGSESKEQGNDAIAQALMSVFIVGLAAGGEQSWARVNGSAKDSQDNNIRPRQTGEALIPFVRVDLGYQWLKADITAVDVRSEIGHSLLGMEVRHTRYEEEISKDDLNITEIHGLYRMSLGNFVEVDIGLGTLVLEGAETHSGVSMTTPVQVHPVDWLGVELRPVWSSVAGKDLLDVDASLLFGWRYASLKAGYRWFRSEHQSLDGPHLGVSLRW